LGFSTGSLDRERPVQYASFSEGFMKNEFTAIIERDGEWYIAYCPEIPGANGQGRTKDEARENLAEAIELILEDRREDALRGIPPDAIRETVTVK
jgi:predicted RNase H-like HicB family nuclease